MEKSLQELLEEQSALRDVQRYTRTKDQFAENGWNDKLKDGAKKRWEENPYVPTKAVIEKRRRAQRKTWAEKRRLGLTAKSQPQAGTYIQTPFGVFSSLSAAGREYAKLKGTLNEKSGYTYVVRCVNNNKDGFKRISVEEYIMLTGKEV